MLVWIHQKIINVKSERIKPFLSLFSGKMLKVVYRNEKNQHLQDKIDKNCHPIQNCRKIKFSIIDPERDWQH